MNIIHLKFKPDAPPATTAPRDARADEAPPLDPRWDPRWPPSDAHSLEHREFYFSTAQ